MDIISRARNKYLQLYQSTGGIAWDDFIESKDMEPEMNVIKHQQREVLKAAAVTYLVSGGRFPNEFSLNSGDFMTEIKDGDFGKFTLITARGGLRPHTDTQWIKTMQEQLAVDSDMQVFAQIDTEDYYDILDETRELLHTR